MCLFRLGDELLQNLPLLSELGAAQKETRDGYGYVHTRTNFDTPGQNNLSRHVKMNGEEGREKFGLMKSTRMVLGAE